MSQLVIDHVVMVVEDAERTAADLRARHGLGSERGPYLPFAGTQSYTVPLGYPAYLEFLTIEDRAAAADSKSGRAALACEASGFGLLTWAVLVDDLDAVTRRLAIDIFDYTIPHGDGTCRGWRAVGGPPQLPFFIDYPRNGDRQGRWRAMYERVGHSSSPTGFVELTIGGSEQELLDWLGPHQLPLRFVDGHGGLREARVATTLGDIVIR